MNITELIFGKSDTKLAREKAERFYLADKITRDEYLKLLDYISWYE